MVEVQKLSSILEAQICTKITAKRWQALMLGLNLCLLTIVLLSDFHVRDKRTANPIIVAGMYHILTQTIQSLGMYQNDIHDTTQ